jgi:hypothetical protein
MGGSAYPSTALLAKETGLSERSVCTHLELAKQRGWLTVIRHGFGDQKWARHEYYPRVPGEDGEFSSQPPASKKAKKGTEVGSVRSTKALKEVPKGTEPNDKKALKEVQCNYQEELPKELPIDTAQKKSSSKRRSRLPESFVVEDYMREWAAEKDLTSPDMLIEGFRDYYEARGILMLDWWRAFQNWIKRDKEFRSRRSDTMVGSVKRPKSLNDMDYSADLF